TEATAGVERPEPVAPASGPAPTAAPAAPAWAVLPDDEEEDAEPHPDFDGPDPIYPGAPPTDSPLLALLLARRPDLAARAFPGVDFSGVAPGPEGSAPELDCEGLDPMIRYALSFPPQLDETG